MEKNKKYFVPQCEEIKFRTEAIMQGSLEDEGEGGDME